MIPEMTLGMIRVMRGAAIIATASRAAISTGATNAATIIAASLGLSITGGNLGVSLGAITPATSHAPNIVVTGGLTRVIKTRAVKILGTRIPGTKTSVIRNPGR